MPSLASAAPNLPVLQVVPVTVRVEVLQSHRPDNLLVEISIGVRCCGLSLEGSLFERLFLHVDLLGQNPRPYLTLQSDFSGREK